MHKLHPWLFAALLVGAPVTAQRLICIDSSRAMSEIDPTTGAKTPIITVASGAGTTGGLAYDPATRTLYTTSTSLDSLYTIDMTTGAATLVGAYGDPTITMHGLEWDSSTGTLYGGSNGNLYTINTTTGLATLVGVSGLTSFLNLGYDVLTDTLYATNSGSDSFYVMNRATGVATLIGALTGPTNPNGVAYNVLNATLYMVDNTTDTLYTINTATGLATAIGSTGTGNLLGLVWLPGSIVRTQHACGTATIDVDGNATIGGSVVTNLGGITGAPFIGLGFAIFPTPFCVCTVGHDWGAISFGTSLTLNIPPNPIFLGAAVGIQGADLLGAGGCPAPQVAFTDTFTVTIG